MAAHPEARISAVILSLALALCAPPCVVEANDASERERAEERLAVVREDIRSLQQELEASRRDHRREQERLKQLDLALQDANLRYRALEEQRRANATKLEGLERQRVDYLASLDSQMAMLAQQVRSSYQAGHQSRMKLVLNQDDPTRIGRMLAYYDFINRAQVARISGLREALATLDAMQLKIDIEREQIQELQNSQQDVLDELGRQRNQRTALLGDLSTAIGSGESRLAELERNRADLQALIERLADILSDIPDDLGSEAGLQQLKGRLPMPVSGPVRHAFGQSRAGGLRWQGWLIAAEAGQEVDAIAYGRVAFADWLRGYGLLMIIDHGQGYLSLYGHNESLLREVGTWVGAGEAIGIVGANPGSDQGMYFELRRNGKAVDPAAWLAR